MSYRSSPVRAYDFLLKFLLVGDSDVGKGEILASLQDGATESPYGYNMGECGSQCVEKRSFIYLNPASVFGFARTGFLFLRTVYAERTALTASVSALNPSLKPASLNWDTCSVTGSLKSVGNTKPTDS